MDVNPIGVNESFPPKNAFKSTLVETPGAIELVKLPQ
jgi:hypothetical protein